MSLTRRMSRANRRKPSGSKAKLWSVPCHDLFKVTCFSKTFAPRRRATGPDKVPLK